MLDADAFAPWSFAAFNYRGYGRSEGRPGEAALTADALVLFDRLAARGDVDPARIVVFGRSLGGGGRGAACGEATGTGGSCSSPPSTACEASPGASTPSFRCRSSSGTPSTRWPHAPALETPVLVLAAERDRIVAPERSRRSCTTRGTARSVGRHSRRRATTTFTPTPATGLPFASSSRRSGPRRSRSALRFHSLSLDPARFAGYTAPARERTFPRLPPPRERK